MYLCICFMVCICAVGTGVPGKLIFEGVIARGWAKTDLNPFAWVCQPDGLTLVRACFS